MSRCFPFPPPGYEKKLRTEPVDLLKKEKHKSKKDKKEKKDREKREGKERKHKDKNKEKHGEKDKPEKDREKKKEKDRDKKKDKEREKKDKEKSRDKGGPPSEKTPEQQAASTHEPKYAEARQNADDNINNKKFVEELHQRIHNEVAGDRIVENTGRIPKSEGGIDSTILQKRSYNEMVQNPRLDGAILQKRMHNEMVQNPASIQKKIGSANMPEGKVTGNSLVHNISVVELDVRSRVEGQKDVHKKTEKKDKAADLVHIGKIENDASKKSEKKDKTTDQVNVEKTEKDRDKEKKKDRKDKEKTKDRKDKDKEKNKDGKDRHKNREKKKEKDKGKDKKHKDNKHNADAMVTGLHVSNNLVRNDTEKQSQNNLVPSNDTERQHQIDGNLKRKVINGFQHEARPNKLPKVLSSSLLPPENGRKLDIQHIGLQSNSDKQVISNSTKLPSSSGGKDQKLNGTVQLSTPTAPFNAVIRGAPEIDEVTQRPAQPGLSRVSSNAVARDATEVREGSQRPLQSLQPRVSSNAVARDTAEKREISQRPLQSLPPRVSSNSVVVDAAEISEGSQRPMKSMPPRASLNDVVRVAAGANEDPQKPQPLPTRVSHNVTRDAGEIGEASQRTPHPDEKHLAVILHVPKMDEWSETDDQGWLFHNGDLLQKKPKQKVEANEEPQVWAKAQRIESSDVLALPYVIPY